MREPWEPVELPQSMEFRIKDHIFCSMVKSIKSFNRDKSLGGKLILPENYGVQMQVNLTVEENTSFNPGFSWNKTWRKSSVAGNDLANTFSVGLGANLSSTATRTDTSWSYYSIAKIAGPGRNEPCDDSADLHGSSPLLQSDLGIEKFLAEEALASAYLGSSKTPKDKKDIKTQVFSYDLKFVIITNGNVTPTWKLVNVSADTGSAPLLGAGRSRTHELILTFGPGTDAPGEPALQTHFNGQIVQQLNRLERVIQQ